MPYIGEPFRLLLFDGHTADMVTPFGMVGRMRCPDCRNAHWGYTILATMRCRTCKRRYFMRTLSASPIDAVASPDGPTDLENRVVDGIESLRQRIVQRLRFRLGEWQLDTRRGTESVLGHDFTAELAAAVINAAIRDEGRAEVTGIANVTATLDVSTRVMTYRAEVADNLRYDAHKRHRRLNPHPRIRFFHQRTHLASQRVLDPRRYLFGVAAVGNDLNAVDCDGELRWPAAARRPPLAEPGRPATTHPPTATQYPPLAGYPFSACQRWPAPMLLGRPMGRAWRR